MLTYRVFTDAFTVLNALTSLYESSPRQSIDLQDGEAQIRFETQTTNHFKQLTNFKLRYENNELMRRVSVAGQFKLPSIHEENFNIYKIRTSTVTFKRDLDLNNLNIDISTKTNDLIEKKFVKKSNHLSLDTIREQPSLSVNKNNNRLAPIASCETIGNFESLSNSSGSKTDEENDKKIALQSNHEILPYSKSANDLIENVLNNAIKANVTDGLKLSVLSSQDNGLNNTKIYYNEENGDFNSDSESDCGIKMKNQYFASSNSSLNDSISSALSTTNLTVKLSIYL